MKMIASPSAATRRLERLLHVLLLARRRRGGSRAAASIADAIFCTSVPTSPAGRPSTFA